MKQRPQVTMGPFLMLHPSIVLEGIASSPRIRLPEVMTTGHIVRPIYIGRRQNTAVWPWFLDASQSLEFERRFEHSSLRATRYLSIHKSLSLIDPSPLITMSIEPSPKQHLTSAEDSPEAIRLCPVKWCTTLLIHSSSVRWSSWCHVARMNSIWVPTKLTSPELAIGTTHSRFPR